MEVNVGDRAAVMIGKQLKVGIVRRIDPIAGKARVSSDPDPCEPGFDINQPHWSVWRVIGRELHPMPKDGES